MINIYINRLSTVDHSSQCGYTLSSQLTALREKVAWTLRNSASRLPLNSRLQHQFFSEFTAWQPVPWIADLLAPITIWAHSCVYVCVGFIHIWICVCTYMYICTYTHILKISETWFFLKIHWLYLFGMKNIVKAHGIELFAQENISMCMYMWKFCLHIYGAEGLRTLCSGLRCQTDLFLSKMSKTL